MQSLSLDPAASGSAGAGELGTTTTTAAGPTDEVGYGTAGEARVEDLRGLWRGRENGPGSGKACDFRHWRPPAEDGA